MCELFGINGKTPLRANEFLKELISHSVNHPDGWGLAVFSDGRVNVEKEPLAAFQSRYLKERLRQPIEAKTLMAHIRRATKGHLEYCNTHPFVREDRSGRVWTMIHNGTIFESPLLDPYFHVQEGRSDSERILCGLIERINEFILTENKAPDADQRCSILERFLSDITLPNNKVNLLVFDGERMYVHTNEKGTLFQKRIKDSMLFATRPPEGKKWDPVPFAALLAYEQGRLVYKGACHHHEYVYNPEDMKYLYLEHTEL